jgi:hypothetical protein
MLEQRTRKRLNDLVSIQMRDFDANALALQTRRGPGYNYHTNVRNAQVHMIRESFYLALSLLDRQAAGDTELAADIINKLLGYQELNRESPYYGIWPY